MRHTSHHTTTTVFATLTYLTLGALATGCANDGTSESSTKGSIDLAGSFSADDGKADSAKSTKLLDDIAPDSVVAGTFDPRVRVYGYVLDAKKGAKIIVSLEATAGADARGPAEGAALDTVMGVYGPFTSVKKPGSQIAESDDNGESLGAPSISFEVKDDAKHLISFSSWEDTGKGKYALRVACEGTDFQCRRPDWTRPCTNQTLYVQGSQINEDTTWDKCEVVMLEPLTVAKEKTLTVKPGVVVKGNYLGSDTFGTVTLTMEGTLQAAGTREHPIAFTSFKADRGWGGIVLRTKGNTISNAFIEKANVGVRIESKAGGTITDTVLEGSFKSGSNTLIGATGISAGSDAEAIFTRALVKGFNEGLTLSNSQKLIVEDSVIRDNGTGVRINGSNPLTQCYSAPIPAVWRDPIFTHTDITANGTGLIIAGSDVFVQVTQCNIINNKGAGIEIRGGALHPDSFIRQNNIFGNNGTSWQVRTYHQTGTLDLSSNYWVHISDPELSNMRRSDCNGTISFTGFHPVPVTDVGPRQDLIKDEVKDACWKAQSSN